MNMRFRRKLPIPQVIKEEYPLTLEMEKVRDERAVEISNVFQGKSDKFLLII